jgi:hypothetical protein
MFLSSECWQLYFVGFLRLGQVRRNAVDRTVSAQAIALGNQRTRF